MCCGISFGGSNTNDSLVELDSPLVDAATGAAPTLEAAAAVSFAVEALFDLRPPRLVLVNTAASPSTLVSPFTSFTGSSCLTVV